MSKKISSIFVCMLLFATVSLVAGTQNFDKNEVEKTDVCSASMPGTILSDPGDVLFEYDVEASTDDNQCLGVEFDGTYYYVTGGGGTTHPDPNKLHFFEEDGTYIASIDQPTVSDWGWRDIAYDGDHMYSSDGPTVVEWHVTGLPDNPKLKIDGEFSGPESPNRALAYDPDSDHFWTANFRSAIYEFDRQGNVINTFDNSYPIYGMAWDDFSPDGPWLWIYDQEGDTDRCHIRQFDPIKGEYTGVEYMGVYHDPVADVAGGACFYDNGTASIFVGLTQNTPDLIFGMDVSSTGGGPELEIGDITGGIGVSSVIKNEGDAEATNVEWSIKFDGGIILIPSGGEATGDFASIAAEGEEPINTMVLGFGGFLQPLNITVSADADNADPVEKTVPAKVFLFFVII